MQRASLQCILPQQEDLAAFAGIELRLCPLSLGEPAQQSKVPRRLASFSCWFFLWSGPEEVGRPARRFFRVKTEREEVILLSCFRLRGRAGDQLSYLVRLCDAQDQHLWMCLLPAGCSLWGCKEMAVVAHVLPHILRAAFRRDCDNERDLGIWWVQVLDLFRRYGQTDRFSRHRTPRGNPSGHVQVHRIGQGIEGTPGEQDLLPDLQLVRGWNQSEPGADHVALRVILQFWVCSQDCHHLVLVLLKQVRQPLWGYGLALHEESDKLSKQRGIALIATLPLTNRLRDGF